MKDQNLYVWGEKNFCFLLYCPETVHFILSELAMRINYGVMSCPGLNPCYKKE